MTEYALPPTLDVKSLTQSAQPMVGQFSLSKSERLIQETSGLGAENVLKWSALGESRPNAADELQPWLALTVAVTMPLTCQRCLGTVDVSVVIDREFRFVDTESQAEQEDDDSEEDVLAMSREFSLLELIEDEVLMDLPLVPRHDVCPVSVKLAAADADFSDDAPKPNPFAALAALKTPK